MTPQPIDLRVYWNKFLANILNLITSRKFWLAAAAAGTLYQQYAAHALTAPEFEAGLAALVVGLVIAIAHEDAGSAGVTIETHTTTPPAATQIAPPDAPKA